MSHAPIAHDWLFLEIVWIRRKFSLSFRIWCVFLVSCDPLETKRKVIIRYTVPPFLLFSTLSLKKKSISTSQNKQAYFGLCFYLRLSPQPSLLPSFPFRPFWVICWHNSVRSLGFEETWTQSPGTQRFLSDNTANTPPADFLHLRHNSS